MIAIHCNRCRKSVELDLPNVGIPNAWWEVPIELQPQNYLTGRYKVHICAGCKEALKHFLLPLPEIGKEAHEST